MQCRKVQTSPWWQNCTSCDSKRTLHFRQCWYNGIGTVIFATTAICCNCIICSLFHFHFAFFMLSTAVIGGDYASNWGFAPWYCIKCVIFVNFLGKKVKKSPHNFTQKKNDQLYHIVISCYPVSLTQFHHKNWSYCNTFNFSLLLEASNLLFLY
jgi:hypothetical protein